VSAISGGTGKPAKLLSAGVHFMFSYQEELYGILIRSNGGELGMSYLS